MLYLSEHHIFIFLVQVFLLLGLARALGEFFRWHKQPALAAEILVGIALGPTIFGRFFPVLHQIIFPADIIQRSMLETVGWLGVLFFLMETGLEIDFSAAWRMRGNALKIALYGVFVPLAVGFCFCLFLPDYYFASPQSKIITCLFLATVMSITAMPVVSRILHDLNLSKTDLGFLIMSALSVNDIMGWLIFSLVLGFFFHGNVDVVKVSIVFGEIIAFTVFCLSVGRRWVDRIIERIHTRQFPEPSTSLTLICLLGLLCGAIMQKMGLHALFGFMIAGVMAGQAKALSEKTRHVISQMVFALFVPLFFASVGLKIDFVEHFDAGIVVFVCVISILGKFFGAWLGATLSRVQEQDRLSVAIAHTPGGTMEIVVGMLALQYGLISAKIFEAIVFGAIASATLVGPWLNYSMKLRKKISILEFFSRQTLIADMTALNRNEAILELCDLVSHQHNMPASDILVQAVFKREEMMGTAIEEGIAFPHARLTSLRRPWVVFGRSLRGIDWNSPDGKLTHFIFLILTPLKDHEAQVQILGLTARAMSEAQSRTMLLEAKDAHDIWQRLQTALTAQHIKRK